MGRPRTIDRDKVLDAAEAVVSEVGAAGLSIDAVARAAGVTKSGVQHSFGTKQQLIDAMFERWEAEYDREVAQLVGSNPDPSRYIRADIEATMRSDEVENARSAVLMAALVQTPEQRKRAQRWYRRRMEQLDVGYRKFNRPFWRVWRVGSGRASAALGTDRAQIGGSCVGFRHRGATQRLSA